MNKIIAEETLEVTKGAMVDKIVEESIETIYRNNRYDRSRNRFRERSFSRIMATREIGIQAIVDPGQDPQQVQTEIG